MRFCACLLGVRVRLLLVIRSWRALVTARRVRCVVAAGKEAPFLARELRAFYFVSFLVSIFQIFFMFFFNCLNASFFFSLFLVFSI